VIVVREEVGEVGARARRAVDRAVPREPQRDDPRRVARGATAETDRDPRLVEELVDALAVPRAGDLHVCRKNAGDLTVRPGAAV